MLAANKLWGKFRSQDYQSVGFNRAGRCFAHRLKSIFKYGFVSEGNSSQPEHPDGARLSNIIGINGALKFNTSGELGIGQLAPLQLLIKIGDNSCFFGLAKHF